DRGRTVRRGPPIFRSSRACRRTSSGRPQLVHESIDERAFSRSRRTGDADEIRATGVAEDALHQIGARGIFVLDERDRTRNRTRVPRQHALRRRGLPEGGRGGGGWPSRWISLVPSPMVVSLTSRKYFSAG